MHELGAIDEGKVIDWGKTSEEYAKYRPGPPISFYEKLKEHGIGLNNQEILDLGTGTGVLARQFAKQGTRVTGLDISEEQINMAKALAKRDGVDVKFFTSTANVIDLESDSFDVVTANQCWLYFDKPKAIAEVKRLLKNGGIFSTSHFCWMPLVDEIAAKTEELILKHNPAWSAHSYSGNIPKLPSWAEGHFNVRELVMYDEPIKFTRESWKGRMRACRGVGVVMNDKELMAFEQDLDALISDIAGEEFEVLHRIDAHIFEPIN
ncbi:MAG: methyltransferase domain-containing protein [Bdellovibrionaceae bacterium]|jgi:SAM-dependent methyltransferase|nr:methyltransferase domain-containing protein [Pseudobdellovibrionaceae bacterium]